MSTCDQCGKDLVKPVRGRPQTRFCSRKCKDDTRSAVKSAKIMAARIGRVCAQCQGPIPETVNLRAKTCSRECGVVYNNRRRQEGKRAAWLASKPPCGHCGGEIPVTRPAGSIYCSPECKKRAMDARWRARWPHYMRKYLYGMTSDQYEALILRQDSRCAICRSDAWSGKGNRPHVDHDHETGIVRGLLCGKCNVAIGNMDDNPDRLRAAADYLEASCVGSP